MIAGYTARLFSLRNEKKRRYFNKIGQNDKNSTAKGRNGNFALLSVSNEKDGIKERRSVRKRTKKRTTFSFLEKNDK